MVYRQSSMPVLRQRPGEDSNNQADSVSVTVLTRATQAAAAATAAQQESLPGTAVGPPGPPGPQGQQRAFTYLKESLDDLLTIAKRTSNSIPVPQTSALVHPPNATPPWRSENATPSRERQGTNAPGLSSSWSSSTGV